MVNSVYVQLCSYLHEYGLNWQVDSHAA